MKIINKTRGSILADNCKIADKFFTRFLGLMGKKCIIEGDSLMLTPCNSIHMFFMRFPLDIIFIDKNNIVIHIISGIKPWRFSNIVKNSCSVIELPVGAIIKSGTETGDQLMLTTSVL